jgi:hypothetical protein
MHHHHQVPVPEQKTVDCWRIPGLSVAPKCQVAPVFDWRVRRSETGANCAFGCGSAAQGSDVRAEAT